MLLGAVVGTIAPLMMTVGFFVWGELWTGSAIMLNLFKCSLASCVFIVVIIASRTYGDLELVNNAITPTVLFMLLVSSTIGIIIGDVFWLRGLSLLGARRVILVDIVKPFLAQGVGLLILSEDARVLQLVGVFITMIGVLIVSLETSGATEGKDIEKKQDEEFADISSGMELPIREQPRDEAKELGSKELDVTAAATSAEVCEGERSTQSLRKGYMFAIANVIFDVCGAAITKHYGAQLTTWEVNLIRFGFAALVTLLGVGIARLFYRKTISTDAKETQHNETTSKTPPLVYVPFTV